MLSLQPIFLFKGLEVLTQFQMLAALPVSIINWYSSSEFAAEAEGW